MPLSRIPTNMQPALTATDIPSNNSSNVVLIAQGANVTGLSYIDFSIDVTKYKTYKLFVRDLAMTTGTSMSIDMLHSTGTFDGWYGGVHAVGESNTAGSHGVFSNGSTFNPAGSQTADQLTVYTVNGEFTLHIATRHNIIYNMFGRFNGGGAQVFNGGALSTLDATPTYLRFGASATMTRISYAWYGIKGGL